MKKLVSLLLALTMVLALAACGAPKENKQEDPAKDVQPDPAASSDLAYVKEKGSMIMGYTPYAPMSYEENGTFTGFDTELATLICERLGVTAEFQEINWDTKVAELKSKSIDCIWNGLTITDELKAELEITQPYVKNAQVVLVKEGFDYETTASLLGKTIVAEQGSAAIGVITADENLSKATLIPKTIQSDCLLELKAGTADAAILDLTLAKTLTGEGTNYTELKIVDRLGEEDYGVGFRKGSDICAAVNKIFDELMADGSMAKLAEKYGLDLAEKAS